MEKEEMMTRTQAEATREQSDVQKVPPERIWGQIIVLGITGGVGAGKSTILTALHEQYGALIIECDEVGRALQQKGAACYEPMRQLFGDGILFPDGTIDRKTVARLIYADAQKREALSRIVHPAVKAEVKRQLKAFDRQSAAGFSCPYKSQEASEDGAACQAGGKSMPAPGPMPVGQPDRTPDPQRKGAGIVHSGKRRALAVVEAALLIDDHYEELCDEIWYIHTDDEKRRVRLRESRHYSDERITRMFEAQRSDASFRYHTQLTIDNTDDFVQNTFRQLKEGLQSHFPELFL
jgi:dephospho-CoA kinase